MLRANEYLIFRRSTRTTPEQETEDYSEKIERQEAAIYTEDHQGRASKFSAHEQKIFFWHFIIKKTKKVVTSTMHPEVLTNRAM